MKNRKTHKEKVSNFKIKEIIIKSFEKDISKRQKNVRKEMKVLLITGMLAEELILKNLSTYTKHEIYLKTIPIPIASFITPKLIVYHIKKENIFQSINTKNNTVIDNIDIILTPGLMKQDALNIQKELNITTYKGPTNAADIKFTLDILDKTKLSTKKSADLLIQDQQYQEIMEIINKFNKPHKKVNEILRKKGNFLIKDCPVGIDLPMRILAEIPNALDLTENELLRKVEYYVESGADMVDLGLHAGENNPQRAYDIVKLVKDNIDIPLSIDTINPNEIKKALKAEVDLVLSLDHGNYSQVIKEIEDHNCKAVIIPTNYKKNYIPQLAKEKVLSLEKLDKKCENIETIADPILDPINSHSVTESILACKLYREQNPHKALFFGAGNVTELLDADSNGVNALLSGIGMELNANILFTTESSLKTKHSISELKTASTMMFIAKSKNTIPKNIGLNLIKYKDKTKKEDVKLDLSKLKTIKATGNEKFIPDREGSFKIIIEDKLIKAIYYKNYEQQCVITGTDSRTIYENIIREELISKLDHAAYLGKELEKAEIALKLDKEYIQDFPIF